MTCLAFSIAVLSFLLQAGTGPVPTPETDTSDVPLRMLPRESLAWTMDGFGHVIGATVPLAPLPERVRSIEPGSPMPSPLVIVRGATSLRILGKSDGGIERDLAVLRWDGPVITWQRMPVPAAAFGTSLDGLAGWLAVHSFSVTLESGSIVRIITEPQMVTLAVGALKGGTAKSALAGFPAGARLIVPDAAPAPSDGVSGEAAGLVSLGCDDLSCRISTCPDTVVDIDVTRAPPHVRVTVRTPSELHLESALRELESTLEILKDAPPEQQAILGRQRAAQQVRIEELRKAAASETVKPTDVPIRACLVDPGTGREYSVISISLVASPSGSNGSGALGEVREPGSPVRAGRGPP